MWMRCVFQEAVMLDSSQPIFDIVPRRDLDFHLREDDIPRYWFGGDPFKTRFFDALSLLFPEGERFFIECVRDFSDQVSDLELKGQIRDFTFQEGQHSRVHREYNARIGRQGFDVQKAEAIHRKIIAWEREHYSRKFTLAQTAAAEHVTAFMAHFFLNNRDIFADADPRIRAIYVWHAIEEIEHKAVAFDVMQKVAKVGYFRRIGAMLLISILFPLHTFRIQAVMFKRDGMGLGQRLKVWAKGLWWLYSPFGGIYMRMLPHYLQYYRPGFHPWDAGETGVFAEWREAFEQFERDPIAATEKFYAAA